MEAIKCLSDLTQLGLISPLELSEWTAKLLGSSTTTTPTTPPTPTHEPAPEPSHLAPVEQAFVFVFKTATKLSEASDKLRFGYFQDFG
jgi:hypothetical protein